MWVSYQLNLKFSCKELAQLDQRTQKSDQPDHLEKDKNMYRVLLQGKGKCGANTRKETVCKP